MMMVWNCLTGGDYENVLGPQADILRLAIQYSAQVDGDLPRFGVAWNQTNDPGLIWLRRASQPAGRESAMSTETLRWPPIVNPPAFSLSRCTYRT